MAISFTKMHGIGNDFILIDLSSMSEKEDEIAVLAKSLCDRNKGIGADGLILILPSTTSDAQMRIINSDGSEPEMCGNGIRCFAKYVYEKAIVKKEVFTIETLGGLLGIQLHLDQDLVTHVTVDMGEPILSADEIPLAVDSNEAFIEQPIEVEGKSYLMTAVSMGNPHAVVFVEDLDAVPFSTHGPLFATHPFFPNGVNVEFVQHLSESEVKISVWERGAGPTLGCGTGACAAVVASHLAKKTSRSMTVQLPGGVLDIIWREDTNHVMMTGPAKTVYTGSYNLDSEVKT